MNENKILKKAFELILQYREQENSPQNLVVNYQSPKELKDKISFEVSNTGESFDELFKSVELYLKYSVRTNHRQFVNQLFAGSNFPSFLAELFTSLSNTSMYTYEVSPVATLIELSIIKKMLGMAGFTDGEGIFVTGGSNSNMLAMMCARNICCPEIKEKGFSGQAPLAAFVSEQAHYSFDIAANMLGIGKQNMYKIKSDKQGRMLPQSLQQAVNESISKGQKPFFIGATSGTTMLGAFDPLREIAAIAKKNSIWFHVDGSFGGSSLLSKKHKNKLDGLNLADSFTWNPHKLMNISLISSVLLLKKKASLAANLTTLSSDYLYHKNKADDYDIGRRSLQCSRRVDSLKLWLAWKYFGDTGYEKRIDKLFDLAHYCEQRIRAQPKLSLMAERQSLTVCFRYKFSDEKNTDKLNIRLREQLLRSGKTMVNYGYLNGEVAIRFVTINADLETSDIDQFISNFLKAGDAIDVLM